MTVLPRENDPHNYFAAAWPDGLHDDWWVIDLPYMKKSHFWVFVRFGEGDYLICCASLCGLEYEMGLAARVDEPVQPFCKNCISYIEKHADRATLCGNGVL